MQNQAHSPTSEEPFGTPSKLQQAANLLQIPVDQLRAALAAAHNPAFTAHDLPPASNGDSNSDDGETSLLPPSAATIGNVPPETSEQSRGCRVNVAQDCATNQPTQVNTLDALDMLDATGILDTLDSFDDLLGFLDPGASGSPPRSSPAAVHIGGSSENFLSVYDAQLPKERSFLTPDVPLEDNFLIDLDATSVSHPRIPSTGCEAMNTALAPIETTIDLYDNIPQPLASLKSNQSQSVPAELVGFQPTPELLTCENDPGSRNIVQGPPTGLADDFTFLQEQFPSSYDSRRSHYVPSELHQLSMSTAPLDNSPFRADDRHGSVVAATASHFPPSIYPFGSRQYHNTANETISDFLEQHLLGFDGSLSELTNKQSPDFHVSGAHTSYASELFPSSDIFKCDLAFEPTIQTMITLQGDMDMALMDEFWWNNMDPEFETPPNADPIEDLDGGKAPGAGQALQLSQPGPQRGPKKNSKRRTYLSHERHQTNMTRKIRGCIRCRMNRKRCYPDENNPTGPCLTCQKTIFNTFNLPCLRYKITDSILYRTSTETGFNQLHPMVGPRYGDFHLNKTWCNSVVKTFDITQDRSNVLRLQVRQFIPPEDEDVVDTKGPAGKGRHMYAIPWAIVNAESGLGSINEYIDKSVETYIQAIIDPSKALVLKVFQKALELASLPEPVQILRNVLRLWTATRFIEGGWRCCGEDKLGAEELRNPLRPSWWVSMPPYVDYQFASLVMYRVLDPLRKKVLVELEKMMIANKPSNWFHIFLVTFILLFNYELNTAFEVKFSIKRKLQVRYSDMKTINATQSGSKTLLAHFHYVCKGHTPFQREFNWSSEVNQRMARLDEGEMAFVRDLLQEIESQAAEFATVSENLYDDNYWFISQLFKSSWKPRNTHEYSPPLVIT